MKKKNARIGLGVQQELKEKIELQAAKEMLKPTQLIRKILNNYLKKVA